MGICLDTEQNNEEAESAGTERGDSAWERATPPAAAFPMQNNTHVKFEPPSVPVIFVLDAQRVPKEPPAAAFPMQNNTHVKFEPPSVPVIFVLDAQWVPKEPYKDGFPMQNNTHVKFEPPSVPVIFVLACLLYSYWVSDGLNLVVLPINESISYDAQWTCKEPSEVDFPMQNNTHIKFEPPSVPVIFVLDYCQNGCTFLLLKQRGKPSVEGFRRSLVYQMQLVRLIAPMLQYSPRQDLKGFNTGTERDTIPSTPNW
ncbi:unnamed protein product [Plutella xylostella]|uniref:(diamondback moth) hypothetical protein n=1 Tax=Plutella xylostella TaxID=51655 RepID=A0A8S4F0P0_PLUXY|nr:unnamed protein product [Plutella xylostella]